MSLHKCFILEQTVPLRSVWNSGHVFNLLVALKIIPHCSYACSTSSKRNSSATSIPPKARGSIINKHSFRDSCFSTQSTEPLFNSHTLALSHHTHTQLSHTPPHLFLFLPCLCEPPPTHTHKHTLSSPRSPRWSRQAKCHETRRTPPTAPPSSLLPSAVLSLPQLLNVRYKVSGWCAHRMHRGMWARPRLPAPRVDIVNLSGRAAAPRGLGDRQGKWLTRTHTHEHAHKRGTGGRGRAGRAALTRRLGYSRIRSELWEPAPRQAHTHALAHVRTHGRVLAYAVVLCTQTRSDGLSNAHPHAHTQT